MMTCRFFSRRFVPLVLSGLLAAGCAGGSPAPAKPADSKTGGAQAQAGVTPALIEAAKSEGSVVWYTSVGVSVAERVAKEFEAKYGVKVEVNRTGSERVLQRLMQEAQANVKAADVVHTSDAGHFVLLKERNMLLQYTPASVAKYPDSMKDKEGYYFAWRSSFSVPAHNPQLISAAEAPKTWKDLLDPKWKGKAVSAHPNYSGTIVTWVAVISNAFGYEYLESLAKQDVMLVQSAQDPVQHVVSGERPLAINGTDYSYWEEKKKGNPVEAIYPTDGVPLVTSPSAIVDGAPHPNAARLFHEYLFDAEAQQLIVDDGLYSGHPDVKYPEGRKNPSELKLLTEEDVKLEQRSEEIKDKFKQFFGS